MIKTRGVVHFTIPVTDPARSRDFYCQRLGLSLVSEVPALGMIFLDSGGSCVVLVRVDKPISTAGIREVHHAFQIAHDEYASAVAELKASGVKIYYEEDRRDGVIEGPRAYFQDPDGNTLEIIDLTFYAGRSGTET
jgi:catechol 2,3-dioxygenase-like lactoylglutathione lyase family enzyme